MEPKEFDFSFPRGDTCPIEFELTDNVGNELNLSNSMEIYFTVKKSYSKSEYLFQKRYSRGEITIDGKKCNLVIKHEDTANMNYGKYKYDIQFKSDDYAKTLVIGEIELTNEITHYCNE